MPAALEKTILITGASGFIAAHVLNSFLEAGYKVRGTVRSEETAKKVLKSHAKYADRLSFAIVPDICAKGAFDHAVHDVDGVIHTASPFFMGETKDNVKEFLDPAIKGTTSILEAVTKFALKVKRVVITSSFTAILDVAKGARPEYVYSEADWNPINYDEAASPEAPGPIAYCASKKFAELAAWKYLEEKSPHFTISVINPPMVYGPLAHYVPSIDNINTSSAEIYRLIDGSEGHVPAASAWAWVDVRDVGIAHLNAYEIPEAANQRFLVAAGNFSWQEICDILHQNFEEELGSNIPVGKPGGGPGQEVYGVDNSKSRKILGLQYHTLEESMKDTVLSLRKIKGN